MSDKERVEKAIIKVNPNVENYIKEGAFITGRILDSLDIMHLVVNLEQEFDVEIEPEDVMSTNFESVESICELIDKCRGQQLK